ncbi:MAG TPA: universal stress protein [Casimicrobiaceae bacterium]|nr:universal stress protein [Casimicrobiaceae bacterium]
MARVLIPFSDFASGQRAVRRLLQEPRDPRQSVELVAMVDPLTSGKVAVFVSSAQAEAHSRAAAEQWIERLAAQLDTAALPHTASIAVGPRRELLRRIGERKDIDRVLLGTRSRDPFRRWRRQSVAHLMDRPLVSVS